MLYFDNAATTKISPISLESYVKASDLFFNASALYSNSMEAKNKLEEARCFFLKKLNGKPNSTLIFTGSATESNNSVLNSHINRMDKKYVISSGEHSSIYETAKSYQNKGYNVVFVPLNKFGQVDEEKLLNEIDETTVLVSIIHVSNETGAVNDIKHLTKQIKAKNPKVFVHSDGVQAVGKININLKDLDVDYYTISAHKINGPKGVGALYIAKPNQFKPFILGGGQEMNLRSGTENLPAICAFKTAFENLKIFDYSPFKQEILKNISTPHLLVSNEYCVPNIISICFEGVRGETILHMLETKGYLIGTGSACNSKAGKNRVISQLVSPKYIDGAIRISFDSSVSISDCENLGKELTNAVDEYRKRIKR